MAVQKLLLVQYLARQILQSSPQYNLELRVHVWINSSCMHAEHWELNFTEELGAVS